MTNKNKKFSIFFIILFLCSASMTAQDLSTAVSKDFSWQAVTDKVQRSGFYNILLDPKLMACSETADYTDFRIYQDLKTEVPYLFKKEILHTDIAGIRSFTVIENKPVIHGTSSFIFSNETGHPVDYVTLSVKNTWTSKFMNVTGSNDLKKWYGLVPEFSFDPSRPQINLPLTDYKYIRLLINDSLEAPLNITGAGQYYNEQKSTSPLSVFCSGMTISNANKTTTIKLAFAHQYVIDNLSFNITAPALYKRQAWVNGESFTLSSGQANEIALQQAVKTDTLVIRIDNQDNPPLKIQDVNAWQVPRYLTAYLEEGKSYLILTGNPGLAAPNYDLSFFADSLNRELPRIVVANEQMKHINKPASVAEKGFTLFTSKLWIWIAIIGIIALLGFMAFRMLRDMQEKK
ncbi:hypothetical protein [Chitinophaga sancti]|uniref:DUF3999 domain-containing protein n=1 Tax=Chitinophaga sancti TaxID=1004 RepID=A0A1K1QNS5_9BACT|nr:hypothetical protein [Chitinophaga sancti]WQD65115.1 hypothetical protein U0033_11985 [Chitinophaga sancti]WQG89261.1 hypothetical protein SR876_30485 [Chitinophaga sancti]SFW60894.1 hypothetical protein SAMN05661012_02919 [Chitinophaga sancti]